MDATSVLVISRAQLDTLEFDSMVCFNSYLISFGKSIMDFPQGLDCSYATPATIGSV